MDDDFTADVKRAIAICKEITKRKLDITWSLDNGIRLLTISEELAENLVASGCRMISVGVESGNKEILHKIKKPLTLYSLTLNVLCKYWNKDGFDVDNNERKNSNEIIAYKMLQSF